MTTTVIGPDDSLTDPAGFCEANRPFLGEMHNFLACLALEKGPRWGLAQQPRDSPT